MQNFEKKYEKDILHVRVSRRYKYRQTLGHEMFDSLCNYTITRHILLISLICNMFLQIAISILQLD